MLEYRIEDGSIHAQYLASTAKIQIFGGGFGNGKTACACIKAINIINDYPNCNGLIARATFPKLNDTIRKEFKKWCPKSLIKSFPESKNSDNTAKFTNGSSINFRYIQQQGKSTEQSTSNLLSATYDFIIVDQMEDPEITEKDFYDLLGRLRGNAIYRGSDPNMPKSGPRFMMLTVNPTGNWFYKRIVKPIEIYKRTGRITDNLLCERDNNGLPITIDGKPIMLVELVEGPTHANARNLGVDFIRTLESTYRGQMRDRFILGQWASYEGLVYPEFSETTNVVTHKDMETLLYRLQSGGYRVEFIEGYDFGITSPSCYLLSFIDSNGAIHVIDGFYEKEASIEWQAKKIMEIRRKWGVPDELILGDPSIFGKRGVSNGKLVGKSTSELFHDESNGELAFRRGNNDILNGIIKVQSYIAVHKSIPNPYTGDTTAPMFYVSDELEFISDEMTAYMWAKDSHGTPIDKPVDKNDHACDTIKYMLTDRPTISAQIIQKPTVPAWMQWQESEIHEPMGHARYGN